MVSLLSLSPKCDRYPLVSHLDIALMGGANRFIVSPFSYLQVYPIL